MKNNELAFRQCFPVGINALVMTTISLCARHGVMAPQCYCSYGNI